MVEGETPSEDALAVVGHQLAQVRAECEELRVERDALDAEVRDFSTKRQHAYRQLARSTVALAGPDVQAWDCPHPSRTNGQHEAYGRFLESGAGHTYCRACGARGCP